MKKTVVILFMILFWNNSPAFPLGLNEIEIHGFASTGYMKSDGNNFLLPSKEGSFEFNEAGINFATSLADSLRIGLQFYSYDLGEIGNNDTKLDWAFLDYHWKDSLGIRLGKIKTPHGLYNEIQDYDMLRTSVLLPQSVYHKYFREIMISFEGAEIYGKIPMKSAGKLEYDLFAGTMNIESDGGIAKKIISLNSMEFKDARFDYAAGGRIKWRTPIDGLMLAATAYQFDVTYKTEATAAPVTITIEMPESVISVFSAEYSKGNLTLAGEYYRLNMDRTFTQDMSALGMPNPPPVENNTVIEAYYGQISYRFTDWFEAGTYYSVYYPDKNDRDGANQVALGNPDYAGWQKDWALSARFDITDFWLVKLELHVMNGAAMCVETDNPDGYEENWTLFAIKTTFNF
ncbi:MAG: hypothetical protein BWK80_05950 [Desulfobacteraceae bacterium IS3]|nr:MAG: hypothetical protein BWK80_05950 [Desulfobacteraceae bacterium IS3]